MDTRFAITEYPNAAALTAQLDALIKKPIYSINRAALKEYEQEYFEKKCAKSKEMITEAKEVIPGGVQHNLAFNYPFPIVMVKAKGNRLWDIDGNEYFDFLQAGLVGLACGHAAVDGDGAGVCNRAAGGRGVEDLAGGAGASAEETRVFPVLGVVLRVEHLDKTLDFLVICRIVFVEVADVQDDFRHLVDRVVAALGKHRACRRGFPFCRDGRDRCRRRSARWR